MKVSLDVVNYRINVPLYLCEFAIKNSFLSPLRLYVYLKARCAGQIIITTELKASIAKDLSVSTRTINNLLNSLREKNWIGFDIKSGYYFIRGFDKIRELENLSGRRGVWFDVVKDGITKERFKAFIMGALIGRLSNFNKHKEKRKQKLECYKGNSEHSFCSHFPVACEALSKIFNISISTASLHKKIAAQYGFIDLKKNLKRLQLGKSKADKDAEFVASYRATHPETAHLVVVRKGKAYLQEVDTVEARMEYTKKWRYKK